MKYSIMLIIIVLVLLLFTGCSETFYWRTSSDESTICTVVENNHYDGYSRAECDNNTELLWLPSDGKWREI